MTPPRNLTPVARQVRKRLLALGGVLESPGIFEEGEAFWVNGKEIGYFADGGALLGLRLTRREVSARRPQLKTDERIILKPSSDWLHVRLSNKRDIEMAVELARIAAAAHRPRPGARPAPPPVGPQLERMRRFH
jgi:hypothetical protein